MVLCPCFLKSFISNYSKTQPDVESQLEEHMFLDGENAQTGFDLD